MQMSFSEDFTHIIFNDSLKQNQQVAMLQDFMYKKELFGWSSFVIYILKTHYLDS